MAPVVRSNVVELLGDNGEEGDSELSIPISNPVDGIRGEFVDMRSYIARSPDGSPVVEVASQGVSARAVVDLLDANVANRVTRETGKDVGGVVDHDVGHLGFGGEVTAGQPDHAAEVAG